MFKKLIADQFRKPRGILGHYSASFMKRSNSHYYGEAIDLLGIRDDDRILEVGCGAGLAIKLMTGQNPVCRIDGLDFSPFMVKKAERNNRDGIRQGRVRIISGDVTEYPVRNESYTKILAVNVIYFWPDLQGILGRLYGMLSPRGRLVLFMSSPERLQKMPLAHDDVFIKYALEEVRSRLLHAGFSRVDHRTVSKQGMNAYYIRADK
jgi:ubiquinone/menaquinone biosynthesis C-methylase UbiE